MLKEKSLKLLQKQFVDHIFDYSKSRIFNDLPYSKKEAAARLNIYRNNVFGNFSSTLSSIYKAVNIILGAEKFDKIVKEYQQKHHSKSGNLDCYGDKFPQFIKDCKPKYLQDLARLELFYHKCYYAREVIDFDIEKFQKINQEKFFDLKFILHPSCFLVKSDYQIYSIWKNVSNRSKNKIATRKKAEYALIERVDGYPKVQKLTEIEYLFLNNLGQNKKIYSIYQQITRKTKKECDIGTILNKFITQRVISDFKF